MMLNTRSINISKNMADTANEPITISSVISHDIIFAIIFVIISFLQTKRHPFLVGALMSSIAD